MGNEVPIHTLVAKMDEIHSTYTLIMKNLQKELALPSSSIAIMDILQDDQMTLKQMTDYSLLDKSTISRQVNQMVKKEWVKKEQGDDRRFIYFSLTEDAKERHRMYLFELNKRMTSALYSWPEEEKQLLYVLLGRLNRSLINYSDAFHEKD